MYIYTYIYIYIYIYICLCELHEATRNYGIIELCLSLCNSFSFPTPLKFLGSQLSARSVHAVSYYSFLVPPLDGGLRFITRPLPPTTVTFPYTLSISPRKLDTAQ